MTTKWKCQEIYHESYLKYYDLFEPKFCRYHDNRTSVICTQFWLKYIITRVWPPCIKNPSTEYCGHYSGNSDFELTRDTTYFALKHEPWGCYSKYIAAKFVSITTKCTVLKNNKTDLRRIWIINFKWNDSMGSSPICLITAISSSQLSNITHTADWPMGINLD